MLLFSKTIVGQKINYETKYPTTIRNVFDCNPGELMLWGNVKSIKVETYEVPFDSLGLAEPSHYQSSSKAGFQVFFFPNHDVSRKIFYNSDKSIASDVEYYNYISEVIKSGRWYSSKTQITTTVDTVLKVIKGLKLVDNKITQEISATYQNNFLPLKKTYTENGKIVSEYLYKYDKDNNITMEARLGSGTAYAHIYFYINGLLTEYFHYPKISSFDSIMSTPYNCYRKITRTGKEVHVTEKFLKETDEYFYDKENKILRHNDVYTTFDDNCNEVLYIVKNGLISREIKSEYNTQQDIVLKIDSDNTIPRKSFEYKYDFNDNWVIRKEYYDDKLSSITYRTIEYY